jgi:3-oxoacyl-[acyl-carrier-protein] synthase III
MPDDENYGESDYSEQDVGNIHVRKRKVTTSGNDEWIRQQKEARERMSPPDRVKNMEKAVNGFRIMSAGDGLLRGGFPKIPNVAEDMLERMKNLSNAMDKFNLTGDNLNVSGNFNDGFTVTRENPCQQMDSQTPQ